MQRHHIAALLPILLAGCGSYDSDVDPGAVPASDPALSVCVRANTDTFPHSDGLSGQTPLQLSGGIRTARCSAMCHVGLTPAVAWVSENAVHGVRRG